MGPLPSSQGNLRFCDPCQVPRADMLRLVQLAGFDRKHLIYQQIGSAADPVVALRDGFLQLIAMARETGSGFHP